jgi:hypothetical protein
LAALAAVVSTGAALVAGPAGAQTPPGADPVHSVVDKTIGNVDGIGPLTGLFNILGDVMGSKTTPR